MNRKRIKKSKGETQKEILKFKGQKKALNRRSGSFQPLPTATQNQFIQVRRDLQATATGQSGQNHRNIPYLSFYLHKIQTWNSEFSGISVNLKRWSSLLPPPFLPWRMEKHSQVWGFRIWRNPPPPPQKKRGLLRNCSYTDFVC